MILDAILHRVRLNRHAEGFIHQKSILTNAKRHVGQRIVIKMDLKDFFPSITFPRVAGMFEKIGYPRNVAVLLAKLTTHKGRMPIGAPTSPTISNIVCRTMDKRFVKLGEKTKFCYSRYADDIAISGNDLRIVKMIPFFKEIIKDEGFDVNPKKLAVLRSGGRQKITGVVVNAKPNVASNEVRKLRAVLHNCRTNGVRKEMQKWAKLEKKCSHPERYSAKKFRRSLLGKINFVKFVNPQKGATLLSEFNKLTFS